MTEPVRLSNPGATVDTLLTTLKNSNLSATHKITRSATLVIAASDSSAKSKAQADYVCTGTNDEAVIQEAIDSLKGTWGSVYLGSGRYHISDTILLYSGMGLINDMPGWSYGETVNVGAVLDSEVDKPVIKVVRDPNYATTSWFPYIKNIHIRGSNVSTHTSQHGIWVSADNGIIDDVYLDHCMVYECGGDGIHYTNGGKIYINSGYVENNHANGIYMKTSSGGYIKDMYIFRNGRTLGYNVKLMETAGNGVTIINNDFRQFGTLGGIQTYSAGKKTIIMGNKFDGGSTYTGPAIDLQVNDVNKDVIISGNVFYNHINGIKISKGPYWGAGKIPRAIITSNIFDTVTNPIYVNGTDFDLSASHFKIRDNIGYETESKGTATITAAATTAEVTHGLAAAPTRVLLSPTTATAGKQYYVSAKAASTFTITIDSAAEAEISFDWQAVI